MKTEFPDGRDALSEFVLFEGRVNPCLSRIGPATASGTDQFRGNGAVSTARKPSGVHIAARVRRASSLRVDRGSSSGINSTRDRIIHRDTGASRRK